MPAPNFNPQQAAMAAQRLRQYMAGRQQGMQTLGAMGQQMAPQIGAGIGAQAGANPQMQQALAALAQRQAMQGGGLQDRLAALYGRR